MTDEIIEVDGIGLWFEYDLTLRSHGTDSDANVTVSDYGECTVNIAYTNSDVGAKLKVGDNVKIGAFDSPEEMREFANWLHQQADNYERWLSAEQEYTEKHKDAIEADEMTIDEFADGYPDIHNVWPEEGDGGQ